MATCEVSRSKSRARTSNSITRFRLQFAGLGFAPYNGLPGITSLTGEMRADTRSGRVDLRTGDSSFDWPQMFRGPLAIKSATGVVVWRQNQNEVRVVSDNLALATPDASARTNLELTLPLDGTSPRLDLASKISSFAIAEARKYLPAAKMPPAVVEWLDAALQGGIASSAEVSFVGPLSAFPFDHDEGQFRAAVNLEHARLAYVADWPWAEDLDGRVEFVNASFAARGSGRVLGLRAPDAQVTIPDLRSAVLLLKVAANGPVLRGARLPRRLAADRAEPRPRVRADRGADGHGRREPRPEAAAARPRQVRPEGRAEDQRRRARVPRLRAARDGDQRHRHAHARRARAARASARSSSTGRLPCASTRRKRRATARASRSTARSGSTRSQPRSTSRSGICSRAARNGAAAC